MSKSNTSYRYLSNLYYLEIIEKQEGLYTSGKITIHQHLIVGGSLQAAVFNFGSKESLSKCRAKKIAILAVKTLNDFFPFSKGKWKHKKSQTQINK